MTPKELAADCRAWRIEHGITMSDIADIAGTSVQLVWQFEHGRANSLRAYCAYLSAGFKPQYGAGACLLGGGNNG